MARYQCPLAAAPRKPPHGSRPTEAALRKPPHGSPPYRDSTKSLIPVLSSPSIEISMNDGTHTRSTPPGATYPREIAIALIACLIAPAPIACTSTFCWLRITPAIAPATATGFEVAETLRTSTGSAPPLEHRCRSVCGDGRRERPGRRLTAVYLLSSTPSNGATVL